MYEYFFETFLIKEYFFETYAFNFLYINFFLNIKFIYLNILTHVP
jgi:hypothetical protein